MPLFCGWRWSFAERLALSIAATFGCLLPMICLPRMGGVVSALYFFGGALCLPYGFGQPDRQA